MPEPKVINGIGGLRALGRSYYEGLPSVDLIQLTVLRRVRVSAKNESGRSYGIDVSHDLLTWSPLLTGFSGDIELSEKIQTGSKFWRVFVP
jgi:hypothetical protein